jgi:hypothetical protein
VIDVVDEACDIRFPHPVVWPTLELDRQFVHRVQSSHVWPIPIPTPPELLLVDGCEEVRDRQLQQFILDGRDPQRSQLAMLCGDIVPSEPFGSVTLPLQSLHQWPDVLSQVLLVRLRAHLIDAVGGLFAEIPPAVRQQFLVEHPIEVAKPILLVACGLLC